MTHLSSDVLASAPVSQLLEPLSPLAATNLRNCLTLKVVVDQQTARVSSQPSKPSQNSDPDLGFDTFHMQYSSRFSNKLRTTTPTPKDNNSTPIIV